MTRLAASLLLAALLLPAVPAVADGLKPGLLPMGEYRRLALDISTRDDVLELFGKPADEIEVKAKKVGKSMPEQVPGLQRCLPAGGDTYRFWKYDVANVVDGGKYEFNPKRLGEPYVYLMFHADGRVCAAFPHTADL